MLQFSLSILCFGENLEDHPMYKKIKQDGILEISERMFRDLLNMVLDKDKRKIQDIELHFKIVGDEKISGKIEEVINELRSIDVFSNAEHPRLLGYDKIGGRMISLYLIFIRENGPYCIRENLYIFEDKLHLYSIKTYDTWEGIESIRNKIDFLPFDISFTPKKFKP